MSVDGGARWAQYKGSDFPDVAVRDIVVHPRASDLVLATHGRGIWIVDDISPLRELTPDLMSQTAAFITARPAVEYISANGGWPEGDEFFKGPSRPEDAMITYYQKGRHIYGDLKIEVFDQQGKLIDTLGGSKHRGVNRAMWPMRLESSNRSAGGVSGLPGCARPAGIAGYLHRKDDKGRPDVHDQVERRHGSARELHTGRSQGSSSIWR